MRVSSTARRRSGERVSGVEASRANEVVDLVQAEREILSYDGFGIAVRDLAQRIVDDGFEPDWILAIARGGLVIGGALAYALGHKNVATINVEFYTGVDARLDVPVELPPVLNLDDIANRRVLVAETSPTPARR